MITICVSIVVDTDDPVEAYTKTYNELAKIDPKVAEWESTDEWYGPDGEAMDEDDISEARMAAFNSRNLVPCEEINTKED